MSVLRMSYCVWVIREGVWVGGGREGEEEEERRKRSEAVTRKTRTPHLGCGEKEAPLKKGDSKKTPGR